MKNILGLDLGTNSVGWALIDKENNKIIKAGSRIIPMDAQAMSDFGTGNLQSAASARTGFRGTRRLYQRAELRRERLLRILNILDFLPEHFKEEIDFDLHPGQFKNHGEPLLPYRKNSEGKNEFIFQDSFREMLGDFKKNHPNLVSDGKKVPYDWTIYYLRKKALTKPISRQELAWIILNFNTKRGYYQLRGKDEAATNKNEEYKLLKVSDVVEIGPNKKHIGYKWFDIVYENGATQRKTGPVAPRKVGDEVELIITTTFDKDGNVKVSKEGIPAIKLRDPKEDDWALMKKRTESILDKSSDTVGEYIYESILSNPTIKVRGKLVHTVERKYYKDELIKILNAQTKYIPELSDKEILGKCIDNLYHQNEAHKQSLADKTFTDFIVEDIIFYQRPLKSKKDEIGECPYEYYTFKDPKTGETKVQHIKCVPKSNPYYQEFRLWQFVQNLRVYARQKEVNGKIRTDYDVTSDFIKSREDIANLFSWLNEKKDVSQDQLLKSPIFNLGKKAAEYRWNYVEEKSYPCNETRYEFAKCLKEVKDTPALSFDQEMDLWHILYSVEDRIDLDKALHSYAAKNGFDEESFAAAFINIDPYSNDYGAYSEKATKRLLSLMRCGKYWDKQLIDAKTISRINHILDGEVDETISTRAREKAINLQTIEDFQNLPIWLACYIIYDRHSEASDLTVWKKPEDIDVFLKNEFKQHSLRNPVVEGVLGETIRVVRDIWKTYGKIDEVHIEMGRDLKQTNEQRKKATKSMLDNQRANFRIRALLQEFASPEYKIDNVRPQSPSQMEIFKIYEDNVLNSDIEVPDDIQVIVDSLGNPTKNISSKEIMKYRLWLEQKYLSPYTGQPIPLSKLFTPAYEIEHVIPQSRYFDDSLSNKVICESEVNKDKGNMLGYQYIIESAGKIIEGANGKQFKILDKSQYEDFVDKHYSKNRGKMKKMLMDDIPSEFIQRQLNDSRYIARKAMEIFSHLVREEGEDTAISKNVIASNGSITDRLKKDWGMNDVWNEIIAPRFERMNKIDKTHNYGEWVNRDGKKFFQINVPLEISKGFSKKRIDHRHHAMDAIVIACATRDHINYMNNSSAADSKKDIRHDLKNKLCFKDKTDANGNYVWRFIKPWETFTQDAHRELDSIIVSFKQNLRVITKMTNHYWHYENGKKVLTKQTNGDGWSVRKSLHKATVSGAVRLQGKKMVKLADALNDINHIVDKGIRKAIRDVIKQYKGNADNKTLLKYFKDRKYLVGKKDISKVEVYYLPEVADLSANRTALGPTITLKNIQSVTDSGIRSILLKHLEKYKEGTKDHPELAFSPEGIKDMNEHIKELNGGKDHKPILKVRMSEKIGLKFSIGTFGSKNAKFVEADKGTNLFFAIYEKEDGTRNYDTVPFNIVVERLKNHIGYVPDTNEKGEKLIFTLSPQDLVYLKNEDNDMVDNNLDRSRIYKFVSCTKKVGYFIPHSIANVIQTGVEFGSLNKIETIEEQNKKISIQKNCIKIKVDRLGNIKF